MPEKSIFKFNPKSLKRILPLALCAVFVLMPLGASAQEEVKAEKEAIEKAKQEDAKKSPAEIAKADDAKKPDDAMNSGTFAGLRMRNVGPAFTSGRIAALAVDPKEPSRYFAAAASGGVWRTINNGTTWTPVFENEGSYSIGAITLDPKNPLVVWVGSGENNSQRSVSYGDGVYKSEDGGKSWKNVGLKTSEHIGKILIDPRDSNVVYVAAQGPLWSPGKERGLYKTTDGGKTWNQILKISENTGVTDIVIDPQNPDTIYAAAYQRRRHVWTLIDGGPESGIHKSNDGGATWKRIRAGLPTADMGRIGLTISPADNNVLYATVEAADKKGGVFRSTDRGESWERRNDFDTTAMYYSKIFADPKNVDRVYIPNTYMMVSDDGGRTVRRLGEKSKHVDNHAMWINPENTKYMLVGSDGGLYESYDTGANWHFKSNLPITQFYDVATDNALPFYNIYGGTQDNSSVGAPSRTKSASGIINADWFVTNGGDGFRTQVDPEDSNIIYAESQNGGLVRFDRKTGERMGIEPATGRDEDPNRQNWDTPFIISPHSRTRLYYVTQRVYRSDDRGDSWQVLSGDITRGLDRNKLPVMGRVWGADAVAKNASTAFYGNASALAESPKKEGLIYVGTDDGLIQVTENNGQTWRKIERFPGVPEMSYVSRLFASNHDANTVYASFDNHWNSDFTPYFLKSTDKGQTWTSIKGNLPANGSVLAINEDHINPNLLFAGTEYGLYFSIDGGQKWTQLKGNLPTIAVRDIAIQRRENDLVIGTFGRGIYILDNYTPLRNWKPEMLKQESVLFPVKDALMFVQTTPLGGRGKASQGESFYNADNPPYGATFTYFLKDTLKTKKTRRQEIDRQADRTGANATMPSRDALRAEEEEEQPAIIFTITDAAGQIVRRMSGATNAGMQRATWDLRFAPASLAPPPPPDAANDPYYTPPSGALVMPGKYRVSMAKRVDGVLTAMGTPQEFSVTVEGLAQMPEQDRVALVEFQQKAVRLQRAVTGALETANSLKPRLALIKRALLDTPNAGDKLLDDATNIDKRLNEILRVLRGDSIIAARNENVSPAISDRVFTIIGGQRMSTTRPTGTQIAQYTVASQDFERVLAQLRTLVQNDLANLEKQMEAAGAPWTPGRIPDWKQQ